MGDDLSDYERVRLENIRRNEAFLQNLGLSGKNKAEKSKADDYAEKKKREGDEEKRAREAAAVAEPAMGTRSSKRLRVQAEKKEESEDEDEDDGKDGGVDYERMPFEPTDLDDQEFEVYVRLKRWRLEKSREEEVEAYKIFPNRVLCEIIRRKRNNPSWASGDNREQCIECWGIAAAKFSFATRPLCSI